VRDTDIIVHVINDPIPRHLKKVIDDMLKKGSPVVRVYEVDSGEYYALEGSHRLTAAKELGFIPVFEEMALGDSVEDFVDIEKSDMIDSMIGYGEEDFDPKRERTVEDLINYISSGKQHIIFFEEVKIV